MGMPLATILTINCSTDIFGEQNQPSTVMFSGYSRLAQHTAVLRQGDGDITFRQDIGNCA